MADREAQAQAPSQTTCMRSKLKVSPSSVSKAVSHAAARGPDCERSRALEERERLGKTMFDLKKVLFILYC